MKRIFYSVLALLLSIQLICVSASATSNSDALDSGIVNSISDTVDSGKSAVSYIPLRDALSLAELCIKQQINFGGHCSWNGTTKVKDVVNFYDFDGLVNAYLFRLMTDSKEQGYIFVNAYSENPEVLAFGYDCNFIPDEANIYYSKKHISSGNHIIYNGGLTFLTKVNDSSIKDLIANTFVDESAEALRESYIQTLLQTKNDKAKSVLNQMDNGIQPYQVIYDQADLANIWTNTSANIFTTKQFPQANNCGPTAGTNFIYYWSHLSPNKIPQLWTNASVVESKLYNFFYTNITTPGTMPYNIVPGLSNYGSSMSYPIKGSDSVGDGTNWSWYTANIKHNLPLILTLAGDPTYQQHVILIVGYQDTSTGKYFRVADGWSATYSNFYKQSVYMINTCYVRW